MKLKEASKKICDSIEETLTYMDFPPEHWQKIRTNNAIERLNREIRRRTRVVGTFPDGHSALMLVCARLRHEIAIVMTAPITLPLFAAFITSSVEEALMEMYLAGVSVRRVEDITEALWGCKVSSSTTQR